ncbi:MULTISPECIES: MerR family transcriptional regulator [Bacillus]|uniref:MerR family transcriptional regulator n=1 Tax=Bacillus TaxID=1386 RepID=UPI00040592AA|nr:MULTISPECIES: MerR family transcriptional regulator [Bacillus cereus group]OTY59500.1 MerR family transcriptional regulator [Bacillus thuringiensis serovar graciosensis]AXY09046.1 MerR family transcriptional regulator [Bacillus thuringiensis LM1212]KXY76708.1 transcriptional regulator [Bacillus cereus]MBJ8353748.1 transcriptional regulator [Bacillus mycoides]MED2903247.1 MerR family transcriptional regulator [Bacillus tropicus]
MNDIFTISDVAKKTGLSTDTIRYYEKINLLPPANRNGNNNRQYVQLDIDRILFINHLKRTQMPLNKIQEYMKFSREKNDEACKTILEEHQKQITIQLTNLQATLDIINYKITHFERIKTGKVNEGTEMDLHNEQ